MLNGLVINTQKNIYFVRIEEEIFQCTLRGKLHKNRELVNSPVIVGDNVLVEKTEYDRGIIMEVGPRKSKFSRQGVGKNQEQLIAANIDQVIIVCSVINPVYKLNGIDRYIVAARSGNIEPVVCFNKIDLINPAEIEVDIGHYRNTGLTVICTSTESGEGIDQLKAILINKVSVFSGSSGVGKSSLVNILENSEIAETGNVGFISGKGRHTTTSARIYDLPFGGMILDTPGMREFALYDSEKGVKEAFSDIEEYSADCRFRNCSHFHEPGCKVKEALENGEIDQQRYNSFLKLARK
jgi:ribosome biogenesis GTPase